MHRKSLNMTSQHNRMQHGEEPNPLSPEVLDHDDFEKDEESTVTFWKKDGPIVENQFSETESEGMQMDFRQETSTQTQNIPVTFHPNKYADYYDDVSLSKAFSDTFFERNKEIHSTENASKPEPKEKKTPRLSNREYSHIAPQHCLQSLSHFFTENEIQMMPVPDAVLSVEDKYFVVLPNGGTSGSTLFHCLGQVITGKERDHNKLRETVVDYICTPAGWDLFGHLVVSFYKNSVDEFQTVTEDDHYGQAERDTFQKRIYKHYFMDDDIEGSLVELVAASFLYAFNFTCIFIQENGTEKASSRIFHSFDEEGIVTRVNRSESKEKRPKGKGFSEMNYFLRIGKCPKEWRWTLVVPYLDDCSEVKSSLCAKIPRGSYQARLWNVYGFNWNSGYFSMKRSNNYFCWKNGTSVIPTSSGKLLGGYATLERDLFSNLCCLLPNCLHKNNECLLQDAVKYCPSSQLSYQNLKNPTAFSDLIMNNKDFLIRKRSRWKKKDKKVDVGTLKDLHKASKIFNFGYYVIGIDEHGAFETLGHLDMDRDKIIYLIARTIKGVITEWRAMGDMRIFKTCSKVEANINIKSCTNVESRTLPLENQANSQNVSTGSVLPGKKLKNGWRRYYRLPIPSRISFSTYFTRLRLFIRRIKSRNKVRQAKSFPLTIK